MSESEELVGESIFDYEEDGIPHEFIYVPHVCIIESPSASDRETNRREGLALSESLRLAGIRQQVFDVHDVDELKAAFGDIEEFCAPRIGTAITGTEKRQVAFPRLFIHFSCHGNSSGIGLTSGEFISWRTLGESLMTFAANLGAIGPGPVALFYVCMSSCSGFHAQSMVTAEACPFIGLVGCKEPVEWSDALSAFSTFYHQVINKGRTLTWAVEAINEASLQRNPFELITCREMGIPGYSAEPMVVLMSMVPDGRFIWLYDRRKDRPQIPAIWPKDECRDPVTGSPLVDLETGEPFPYFEHPWGAVEYMQTNPGAVCQVERGAAQEIKIRRS